MTKLDNLSQTLKTLLDDSILSEKMEYNELTITVAATDLIRVMQTLKDNQETQFEQCMDLCGIDYLDYHNDYIGPRFAVVYHLLSLNKNWRLSVKVFAKDSISPIIPSIIEIWSSVNWYEREAFDLFGIIFDGHPDLRRILTDYGFIGYPFRKDFPVYGHMEMIYDEIQKRVVYQPVTIEPRENITRVIREDIFNGH